MCIRDRLEDHPQTLFEQVGAVELRVGGGDPGEFDLLVLGEVLGVLPQRVPGSLQPLGELAARTWWRVATWASAATLGLLAGQRAGVVPGSAADLIERIGGPVRSARGAVPAFRLVRFPGPPPEPDVRLSPHPALHEVVPMVMQVLVRPTVSQWCPGSGSG